MTTASPEDRLCRKCDRVFPSSSPEGLCPLCLALLITDAPVSLAGRPEHFGDQQFFGDYELLEELGRGGSGIVFKARQLGVNRTVALKLLSGGPAAGRDFVHRFHTEASATAQLEHPNIVPVYEFGEHEGAHYLSVRYLEGGTLEALIAQEPIAPLRAASLMIAIASAVEHAHRHGVLHRDLKPGNILLDAAGTPYVTDFGLARRTDEERSLTLSHSILGTISYLAPEVARSGATHATIASDIYGLGAILYELLTRRPPFSSENIVCTLSAIESSEPAQPRALNPRISVDLETICLKCLEKDPAKRYPTVQAVAEDLQRFLNNEPITARAVSYTGKLIRWSQRNPALATAYSLLILILIVVLIASPLAILRIDKERRRAEAAASSEAIQRQTAEQQLYAQDMYLAQQALLAGDTRSVARSLNKYLPPDRKAGLRGWEWHYYRQQTRPEDRYQLGSHLTNAVTAVGILPDGKTAWSAGLDKMVYL